MKGKHIVIAGEHDDLNQIRSLVEKAGATVQEEVQGNTDLVVVHGPSGVAMKQAGEYEIPILGKDEFVRLHNLILT